MNIFNKNFLTNEIIKWRDEGIIDKAASEKIAALYDIDLQNVSDNKSFILKIVAYLFFSLSLITLIGANWEEMPRFVRLLIVVGILAFVNLSAFFVLKKGNETQSTALFFLGNFCYGAAIALIAQIYHLGEHMPDGVLLWAIGAFVLSIAAKNSILVAQSLAIALVWFIMEIKLKISHEFLIFIAVSIYMLLKNESKTLTFTLFVSILLYLLASVLSLRLDLFSNYFWLVFANQAVLLALSYSLLGISLSLVAGNFHKFQIATVLKNSSLIAGIFSLLFAMSFISHTYYDFAELNDTFIFYGDFYGNISIAFNLISLAILLKFKRYDTAFLCVFLIILPLIVGYAFEYANAVYSLLSVIAGIVLIKRDYLKLGLSVIFIVANVRYIDLIGDYIGASLLFLIFAVIVLVVSRSRKRKAQ